MKILFFGDIVGRMGRHALARILPELRSEFSPDIVIANGENMAHGQKITPKTLTEILASGVDIVTSGDHHKSLEELAELSALSPFILRPANYPPAVPGTGSLIYSSHGIDLLVINLMGRVFMKHALDCPFRTLDAILAQYPSVRNIFIDFHAEATSEKIALGWHADGRASAVAGTHTHVPTADARILPGGTAYLSDAGMVGPRDGVLGVSKQAIITSFLTQISHIHEIPERGISQINAVLIETNNETGKAISITRVDRELEI